MNRIEVGEYLRHQRKKLNKTLKEMSAVTGLSFPYLSDIENGGVKQPRYPSLSIIAEHYKVDLNLLLEVYYPSSANKQKDEELTRQVQKAIEHFIADEETREKVLAECQGNHIKKLLINLHKQYKDQLKTLTREAMKHINT